MTNYAEEALSKRALASIEEPLGTVTRTWQVMSNELDLSFTAAFDATRVPGPA